MLGTKRVLRSVGLGSKPNLAGFVAPELKSTAGDVAKCMQSFNATCEQLLMKYNKNIIHEQFVLNRLANPAIDIYIMTVLLSRATNSINKKYKSAEHEINLVKSICQEKCEQVELSLQATKSADKLKLYKNLKKIAENVYSGSGINHVHPIDQE